MSPQRTVELVTALTVTWRVWTGTTVTDTLVYLKAFLLPCFGNGWIIKGIKLHKVQFSWESRRPFISFHHGQEQFCAHTPLKHLNSSARMNYQFVTLSKAYSSTQLIWYWTPPPPPLRELKVKCSVTNFPNSSHFLLQISLESLVKVLEEKNLLWWQKFSVSLQFLHMECWQAFVIPVVLGNTLFPRDFGFWVLWLKDHIPPKFTCWSSNSKSNDI